MKYHLGATGTHLGDTGETITVTVAPNPSHLEFVDPVVEGMVRAKQDAIGDREHARVLPVLLHGDAAFAGQGVVAETMHLSGLHGYRTGGTIHVVVNNQIGFTTLPEDARCSTYATDVAKMVHAPAFHVNGDDPEAVAYVAGLALEYRQKFRKDVVIDLVCYRRWGHNETDEPSYTQPLMYAKIKTHPSAATLYGEKLVREGVVTREELERVWAEKKAEMQSEKEGDGTPFVAIARRAPVEPAPVDASAMWGRLKTVLRALGTLPDGFEIHPKLVPFVRKRAELLEGKGEVDWATAESLAWGTLLLEGVPVRLSGQDSGRGTFSQRHAVLHDVRTQKEYVPLNAVAPSGVRFEVYDSLLSEAAVMGFEYGYSVAEHRTLVLWEAQFGDFMNGAQVIIDQFLAGSETKWGQPSGLTLLLPHGHEGQGPEHSSARIERFLTLSAEDNLRVAYPSTPASYFHLLRLQGRDPVEKPLVVFTPKSLLRHPRCVSPLAGAGRGPLRAGDRRRGRGPGARRPRGAVQRQGLLRPAEGPRGPEAGRRGAGARRAALPVPGGGAPGGARPVLAAGRDRLVPGGAAQHGRVALRARALPGRRRRGRRALAPVRGPRRLGGAGPRLAQGAPGRAGRARARRPGGVESGAWPARKGRSGTRVPSARKRSRACSSDSGPTRTPRPRSTGASTSGSWPSSRATARSSPGATPTRRSTASRASSARAT